MNLRWYAELEWLKSPQFDGAQPGTGTATIIEKNFGRLSLMINRVFEKVLSGEGRNQGLEFGHRDGICYRWMRYVSPGVEFYGGAGLINDTGPKRAAALPFSGSLSEAPRGIRYGVGPGFGLTSGSDHVLVKFTSNWENTLGTLFGPSSEASWFF